jgi:hypothetical protein
MPKPRIQRGARCPRGLVGETDPRAGSLALSPVGSRRVRPRIGHTGGLYERGTAKCLSATIRVQSLHRLPACRLWRPRVSPLVTRTTFPRTPETSSTRSWSTGRPSPCSCPRSRRPPNRRPRVRCYRRLPRPPTSTWTSTTSPSRRLRELPSRPHRPRTRLLSRPPRLPRPPRPRRDPCLARPGFVRQHQPPDPRRPRQFPVRPGPASTSPPCRQPRCLAALPPPLRRMRAATPAPAACLHVIRRLRRPRPSHSTWIPT